LVLHEVVGPIFHLLDSFLEAVVQLLQLIVLLARLGNRNLQLFSDFLSIIKEPCWKSGLFAAPSGVFFFGTKFPPSSFFLKAHLHPIGLLTIVLNKYCYPKFFFLRPLAIGVFPTPHSFLEFPPPGISAKIVLHRSSP